jgi:hypothetical protein
MTIATTNSAISYEASFQLKLFCLGVDIPNFNSGNVDAVLNWCIIDCMNLEHYIHVFLWELKKLGETFIFLKYTHNDNAY